jgi:DNA-binding NtrC family response regulator
MSTPTLLIVDDDESFLGSMRRALRRDYEVRTATSREEALDQLSPPPDVVLLDLRLDEDDPDNQEGIELLQTLNERFSNLPVLMITAYGDVDTAVQAMHRGAVDFIQKQAGVKQIKSRLERALERGRLSRRVSELEREIELVEPREIVGQSETIQEVKQYIEALARDGDATVLIRGETGTGKELVARAIHATGERRDGPFVPVVLNALSDDTIESELFGYEKGAFTGAEEQHAGYLEEAHGGVLFLDEIGEMPSDVQVKLLRFLEERQFERLGSTEPIEVDVQIVTATNADLAAQIDAGDFREDLYYRLKVHEIVVPPLRERRDDISLLVDHFLQLFRQQGKEVGSIHPDALGLLRQYDWPGNVRQLKNALESAIFRTRMHEHDEIRPDDLPAEIRQSESSPPALPLDEETDIDELLARDELAYAEQALKEVDGKITEAWELLGYNDRFVFSRRIRRILERHPDVAEEFPYVQDLFQSAANEQT